MKRSFLFSAFCYLLSAICLQPFAAAEQSAFKVKTTASPTRVTVGDEINLMIQVERPKKAVMSPPSSKINLSPFELKRIEMLPPLGKNRVKETVKVVLTIFELGDFKIPPVALSIEESGRVEQVFSDPVDVKVVEVPKRVSDKDDIRPIKGPVSLGVWRIAQWVLGFLALALSILLMVKIIFRRLRQKEQDLESLLPAHERALLEWERLKAKGFLEARKIKEFYSELANILRRYVERSLEIETLELTTPEIMAALKEKNFREDALEKSRGLLENADLVKFAKFFPPRSLADELAEDLLRIIDWTRPAPQPPQGRAK